MTLVNGVSLVVFLVFVLANSFMTTSDAHA